MTKYRIRLKSGRVIGPFVMSQLHELKSKGYILGDEEAQVFPTGDWCAIKSFKFYNELEGGSQTAIMSELSKDETFVIDLAKLRNQKNEKEIEKIDVLRHEPVQEMTQTVYMKPLPEKVADSEVTGKFEMDFDHLDNTKNAVSKTKAVEQKKSGLVLSSSDKTLLNPVAQEEIARMRREKKVEEDRLQAQELIRQIDEDEDHSKSRSMKLISADESTQMIDLGNYKIALIETAVEEEEKLAIEAKEIKKKKKKAEKAQEDDDDEEESAKEAAKDEDKKKKKKKLFTALAIGALVYALMFPDEEKSKTAEFQHVEPVIEFPIPFDKADSKKSKAAFEKGRNQFVEGDYLNIIKAGKNLKISYENNIDSEEALNLLVRNYAEQLRYSREDKLNDSQIVFNLIQARRPFLAKDPNGVIGLNLFYMAIGKHEAAADVVSRYLKLYPKNVTQDLFAVYVRTLLKTGRLDWAKQFLQPLIKTQIKNRYTYDALIEYSRLNQEDSDAIKYVNEAIKAYPKLVGFYLIKADLMIKAKDFSLAEKLLEKTDELKLENNNTNRAKYLELKGLIIAHKGDVKKATTYFTKSLQIEDSTELRMKLADLSGSNDMKNDTDKLIAESKALKLLLQAKDFMDKKSYELALSSAAKATDAFPGHIPSELFLAEAQLKLGLARQSLKTLEELVKKYPDNRRINLALIDAYIKTYKFNDAKTRIGIISGTDIKNTYEFASANSRLYIKMGDSLQAISWLRNSISMNPLNDGDIFLLAELLIKRANFDAARTLLNKCMELDPVNIEYRIAYSKIIYEQQDDQAAIGYLLGLLNEFGESPRILSEIGIFYYRAGKVKDFQAYKEKLENMPVKDKALYEFLIRAASLDERYSEIPILVEQLLAIEPGDLEAMMTAGKVLYEEGKLVEAAKWFKRIQEKLDTYPKVQLYIAKIKYLSKDLDGALKEVEADVKSNGDNDAGLTLMAQIYAEKGELVQAENFYKRAQKLNPRAFESLVGLADISTKRNNFDLALDLYKKAMREKGDEPIIHKKIGDVYRLLGQGALAVESYKLYLDMSPEASDKGQVESYINLMQ